MHVAFYGRTESGKTYAMRKTCESIAQQGFAILVLDHKRQQWPTPYIFTDKWQFLEAARKSTSCALAIDEGKTCFSQKSQDADLLWLPNESRHNGHLLLMASQRPKQVPPDVRSCFSMAYCFGLLEEDAREVCRDFGFGKETYKKITLLPPRVCVKLRHFGKGEEITFS